jgi:hypothetical protein
VGVLVGGSVVGVFAGGAVVGVAVAAGAVVACGTGVATQAPAVAPGGKAGTAIAGRVIVCPARQKVTFPAGGVWAEAPPVVAAIAPIAAMRPTTATAETCSKRRILLLGRCER